MSDAIVVEGLGKSFRLPLDKPSTLKHRVTHWRSSSRWREFRALDDVSFTVPTGQFIGIIGHNGSGKSTLLKVLSKIYVADRGTVRIEGLVSPFLELGVGFNPELTARENVYLNGAVLGLTRRDLDERRVDGILRFAEVAEFAEQKLKNFSSGMQVRLAFSVAIQANAEILLMDEVLAVGDARFAEKCFDVFARYKREGRTIVLVTHDLGSVQLYCDRVLLLDHGHLIADGLPTEVAAQYRRMVGAQSDAEDEAEMPSDAPVEEEREINRFGSREVSIRRVRLLRGDGTAHHSFTTGEPVTVEVDFEVHDDSIGMIVCGLAFIRRDGVNVSGPNTATSGHPIPCPPKGTTGRIRYTIESLGLLGASYELTAALYDRHCAHAYDHIDGVASFRVVDEVGRLGIVDLQGRWETETASQRLLVDAGQAPRVRS